MILPGFHQLGLQSDQAGHHQSPYDVKYNHLDKS